jgi:hypothetical protein
MVDSLRNECAFCIKVMTVAWNFFVRNRKKQRKYMKEKKEEGHAVA